MVTATGTALERATSVEVVAASREEREMGYEFECTNVVPGCEGKVRAETKDDVVQKAAQHAAEAHGMPELPDEVVEKVKASIVAT